MRARSNILKLCLMIYTFLVIYTPNIFSNQYINYALVFFYLVIALIFLKPNTNYYKIRGIFKSVAILVGCWIFVAIFFVIRALIAGVEVTDIVNLRIVQTSSLISIVICVCKIEKQLTIWGYDKKGKIKFILNVAMIQAFIVVIMLAFPKFRTSALNHFYQYGNGNEFTMAKRVYGIMLNYTFATPIYHGFLLTLAFTYGLISDKKMYLYIPFLVLMIMLNGRTGMLIALLGILLNTIYFAFKRGYAKKILLSIIICLILIYPLLKFLEIIKPETYHFFISAIDDVLSYFIEDEKNGNIGILSENFEKDINTKVFLIGNGHRIQNKGDIPENIDFHGVYSDMGYLNDMYMGGIIYMSLIYLPLVCFIIRDPKNIKMERREEYINNLFKLMSIATIFICNIKGEVFRSSIIIAIIVYYKIAMFDDKEKEHEKSIDNNVNLQN